MSILEAHSCQKSIKSGPVFSTLAPMTRTEGAFCGLLEAPLGHALGQLLSAFGAEGVKSEWWWGGEIRTKIGLPHCKANDLKLKALH